MGEDDVAVEECAGCTSVEGTKGSDGVLSGLCGR